MSMAAHNVFYRPLWLVFQELKKYKAKNTIPHILPGAKYPKYDWIIGILLNSSFLTSLKWECAFYWVLT